MTSRVTVLIRTLNNQATIERALQSVFNQTENANSYSILVVDDSSSDTTLELIKTYEHIEIIENNLGGCVAALNIGIEHVKTPYVIYLDSDDWFEPTILERMNGIFERNPSLDFVYCDYYEVSNGIKKLISVKENIFNTLAAGIMFSVNTLNSHGKYDWSLVFSEYDLLIRMLSTSNRHHLSQPLYNYFRHRESMTADKELVELGRRQLFEKYGKHYPIREY